MAQRKRPGFAGCLMRIVIRCVLLTLQASAKDLEIFIQNQTRMDYLHGYRSRRLIFIAFTCPFRFYTGSTSSDTIYATPKVRCIQPSSLSPPPALQRASNFVPLSSNHRYILDLSSRSFRAAEGSVVANNRTSPSSRHPGRHLSKKQAKHHTLRDLSREEMMSWQHQYRDRYAFPCSLITCSQLSFRRTVTKHRTFP